MSLLLLLRPAKDLPRGGHFIPDADVETFPRVIVEREPGEFQSLSVEQVEDELSNAIEAKASLEEKLRTNALKEKDLLLKKQKEELLQAEILRMKQIIEEDEVLLMIFTFL